MSNSRRHRRSATDTGTLIAYYQGAYGSTLRIDVQTLESLSEIKHVVEQLSSGHLYQFSLGDLSSAILEAPLIRVTLRAASIQHVSKRKRVTETPSSSGTVALDWEQAIVEWEDTAGLIEGLSEAALLGTPAHQYLTDESKDDIIIELSFQE